jgi:hypothetical protein
MRAAACLPRRTPQMLHGRVSLVASKAAAIHHLGQPVARAAGIAELACDPSAAVDLDCALVRADLDGGGP